MVFAWSQLRDLPKAFQEFGILKDNLVVQEDIRIMTKAILCDPSGPKRVHSSSSLRPIGGTWVSVVSEAYHEPHLQMQIIHQSCFLSRNKLIRYYIQSNASAAWGWYKLPLMQTSVQMLWIQMAQRFEHIKDECARQAMAIIRSMPKRFLKVFQCLRETIVDIRISSEECPLRLMFHD